MDSFTDVLENLQTSHSHQETDHLSLKREMGDDMNSFSNDGFSYLSNDNNVSKNVCVFNDISQKDQNNYCSDSNNFEMYDNDLNSRCVNQNFENQKNNASMSNVDKSKLLTIIHLLKKYNFTETERILLKETTNIISEDDLKNLSNVELSENTFSSLVYRTEENPNIYEDNYKQLQRFVDNSLDSYRHELSKLLYPVFVHMYLELVCSDHEDQAISFMKLFGKQQEFCFTNDINKISLVTKQEHFLMYNDILEGFRNSQQLYTIRLSRDSHNYLKRFLQEKSQTSSGKATILVNIIQERLFIDVYEGLTRNKTNIEALSGAMFGEATREISKNRIYYGLFKEPDFKIDMFDLDMDNDSSSQQNVSNDLSLADGSSAPLLSIRKRKLKKDSSQAKKTRNDPNAPPFTRIPLPELRDSEQHEKIRAKKEATKALKLGNGVLPSICLYSLLNAQPNIHETSAVCAEISDDSTLLAVGFSDSLVRIWSLSHAKLRGLKPAYELENLDKEADDIQFRMMKDQDIDMKIFHGHNGPVFGLSFSPCKDLLLSCSEDSTIRLWSLLTWTNVVVYRGHCFPVWDVKFSPHGYYFASCSHDRTARLWATDNHNSLRLFAGHFADVDCLQFHPNSNYIATGSSDRSIRLWDCLNGQCVRHMTGHKGYIHILAFENSGRFLASAGADKRVLIWDIPSGHLVVDFSGYHNNSIYTLTFNRGPESLILASGGLDNRVILWNMQALMNDIDFEELTPTSVPTIKFKGEAYILAKYPTKSTSILLNHFTRRNLLISIGSFHQS